LGDRVVVTVTGKDRTGIVAGVSKAIADCGGNILDMSQTILSGFFAMIMLVDIGESKAAFEELDKGLRNVEKELGVKIIAQHEEVFQYMHRI
jgi:ACT domain-containing protein